MKKISEYFVARFSVLLVGLSLSLGCECCCDCKDEQVSTLTIPISFFPTYTGRTCAIPIPSGSLTGTGLNIIPFLTGGNPFLTTGRYYLWVEFESCCDNFKNSEEFVALSSKGLAYYYDPLGHHRVKYIFPLNVTAGGTTATIPIPTGSDGPTVEGISVKYYEPCMNSGTSCESPYPCFNSSTPYRPYYESGLLIPWSSADPHANVTAPALLMHVRTECDPPEGWLCTM